MVAFLIRRIIQSIIVVIGVSLFMFILSQLLPGGVARAILGPRATAAQIHAFNVQNGFNLPAPVQYISYLNQIIHGNFGYSYKYNQSVASLLQENLPKTLLLMGLAYAIALVVAMPIGMIQAVRRNGIADYSFTSVSFILYAMPTFWLGIILIIIFSLWLNLVPPTAPQAYNTDFVTQVEGLILPVATLSLVTIALFSRYMRSSVLDNIVQDYVRTARAKGASERRVLYGHVMRNALIPIVTLLGVYLPVIFSGALVTEAIFNYPGMGLLFYLSALARDYPVVLGTTLVVAIVTVVGNLFADIGYAVVDPRVRLT